MTDKLDRLRKAMKRRPDATRLDLTRETVEALLSEIDRLTEQRDNMVAAHALAQIREQNTRAALAAAPQPAPMDREALVEVIVDADDRYDRVQGGSWSGAIADALLARGLRLPGGNETMAWAVVGDDGKPEPHLVSALKQKAEQWVLPGRHLVRVAIRVVEGGDDA